MGWIIEFLADVFDILVFSWPRDGEWRVARVVLVIGSILAVGLITFALL